MNSSKKILLSTIGIAVLIVVLTGITFSFFNYTRTGASNNIRVGRIFFESKNEETITLNNLFPIDPANTNDMNDSTKVGTYSIDIKGDTDYVDGIEYLVSATDVDITTNQGKKVPISFDFTVTGLGTPNANYFTERDSKNANIYKQIVGANLQMNQMLLVGYIKPNTTSGTAEGVDGNITIKAYLDKNKVAITDTYDGTESDTNGTTNDWVDERVVLTTNEWNTLQSSGISFKIKVEANEGIWVEEEPTPDSCFITSIINENELMINYYDESCGTDVIIPKKMYHYNIVVPENITSSALNVCMEYFSNMSFDTENGESLELFCRGTGTMRGYSLADYYDIDFENSNAIGELSYLRNNGVIEFVKDESMDKLPVTTIGTYYSDGENYGAFSNKYLTSVILQDGIKEIGYDAFSSNNLTSLIIPNSVITIRGKAFQSNKLDTVTFYNNIKLIEYDAFNYNKIKSLMLGDSIEKIGERAFFHNELTNVSIGNGIQLIGAFAFGKDSDIPVSNMNLSTIIIDKTCSAIKNMTNYNMWLDPQELTGTTIYGSNNEVCDAW